MRQLATIQNIKSLDPIEGKDRIELCSFENIAYKVIVQKGQFKIGDLCIYIEIDSLLPEKPEFEFLRQRCWSKKWHGFRIKIMKMGNVYSYGIAFPLSIIKDSKSYDCKEGNDLTKLLEIRKYDPELLAENNVKQAKSKNPIIRFLFKFKIFRNMFLKKHIKLPYPSHLLSKWDESRIQAVSFILNEYKGVECYVTEKLDGCSAMYVWNKNKFMVCSRNIEVVNKNSKYWKIAEKYDIKNKLKNTGLAIQGEIIGHSENASGRNIYMSELDFYVFNVVDTKTRKTLCVDDIIKFCKENDFKMVPVLDTRYVLGTDTVDELIEIAKGQSQLYDVEREGIVIRDINNEYRPIRDVGDSLSFKVINPDFLLKYCNKE